MDLLLRYLPRNLLLIVAIAGLSTELPAESSKDGDPPSSFGYSRRGESDR